MLRSGVIIAATFIFVGGIFYLISNGRQFSKYNVFLGEPAELRNLGGIAQNAVSLHSLGVIQFGLLLLIATPVARVAFSVFAFARQRDLIYLIVTLIVLAVLLYSLFRGQF